MIGILKLQDWLVKVYVLVARDRNDNTVSEVATKYHSNYLHWFEFIDSIGKEKIQKVAERDPLLRACSVKAV